MRPVEKSPHAVPVAVIDNANRIDNAPDLVEPLAEILR